MGGSTTALGCLIYMGKGEASISYCLSLALSFTDNPEAQILCPKKEFKNYESTPTANGTLRGGVHYLSPNLGAPREF